MEQLLAKEDAKPSKKPLELAVAGTAPLAALMSNGTMQRILLYTRIWARTSPADKAWNRAA